MKRVNEVEKSIKINKFFKNAINVYWIYGWRKIQGVWKWSLVTAFDNQEEYKKYVEHHEQRGRKLSVYHADLVKKTTRKIYETSEIQEEIDLPEVIID